jgi:hypothetical protein
MLDKQKKFNDTGQLAESVSLEPQRSSSNAVSTKRISFSLSGDTAQLLELLAKSQGITQNEALRKAIATEAYIRREIEKGTNILLQKPDGKIQEVVFR